MNHLANEHFITISVDKRTTKMGVGEQLRSNRKKYKAIFIDYNDSEVEWPNFVFIF